MANEGLLYHPIADGVAGAFSARRALHNTAKRGPVLFGEPGGHARRLAASCSIRNTVTGLTLKMNPGGFDVRYSTGEGSDEVTSKRLPVPSLTKVTIKRVTTTAERINLTLEILAEFEVYTYGDFEVYAKSFLRRPESSAPLTIEFGHIRGYDGRGGGRHAITGAWVIGGGYTQEGAVWKCRFKAIAPANAIIQLDMSMIDDTYLKGKKFKAKVASGNNVFGVSSFHEYLLYALQNSGQKLTEDLTDGEEITAGGMTVGKVYKPFQGVPSVGSGQPAPTTAAPATLGAEDVIGVDTLAAEYLTLGYIVEAVNKLILGAANKREPKLKLNLRIDLDPEAWSYVPGSLFKSGYPTDVLFLNGSTTGAYHDGKDTSTGKNFEINVGDGCKSVSGYEAVHSKILLSRRAVIAPLVEALTNAEKERQASIKQGKGVSLSDLNIRIMSVGDFFEHIFNIIKNATGGYVNLTFSHPFREHANGGTMQVLEIINASMIYTLPTSVLYLRPLSGDGSTLTSTFDGKLPDNMVALAIITGTGTGSHTSGRTAGSSIDEKHPQKVLARQRLSYTTANATPPGVYAKIAASNFAAADMAAACSALADYYSLDKPSSWRTNGAGWTEYFDTELTADMEGLFPFLVGNRITSESVPKFLSLTNQMSFVVLDVDDVIESPGVWTTSVRARLCHHPVEQRAGG